MLSQFWDRSSGAKILGARGRRRTRGLGFVQAQAAIPTTAGFPGGLLREFCLRSQTLKEMDGATQHDVASLLAGETPCEANATKCEYCPGGCQDLQGLQAAGLNDDSAPCKVNDVGGPWIERTRWAVPHNQQDVIVYRAVGSDWCFSTRSGEGPWRYATRNPHHNLISREISERDFFVFPASRPTAR